MLAGSATDGAGAVSPGHRNLCGARRLVALNARQPRSPRPLDHVQPNPQHLADGSRPASSSASLRLVDAVEHCLRQPRGDRRRLLLGIRSGRRHTVNVHLIWCASQARATISGITTAPGARRRAGWRDDAGAANRRDANSGSLILQPPPRWAETPDPAPPPGSDTQPDAPPL
jgi:hypothetical protein